MNSSCTFYAIYVISRIYFHWGNRTLSVVWDSKPFCRKFRDVLKFGPRAISICRSCYILLVLSFTFPSWTITCFLAQVKACTICKNAPWFIRFVLHLINSELKMRCLYVSTPVSRKSLTSGEANSVCHLFPCDFFCWPSKYFLASISAQNLFHSTFSNWGKLWTVRMNFSSAYIS